MSGYMYSAIGPEENSTWIKIHLLKARTGPFKKFSWTGIQKRHAMGKKPILVTLEEFQDLKKHLEVQLEPSPWHPIVVLQKFGLEIPRKLCFVSVWGGGWKKGVFVGRMFSILEPLGPLLMFDLLHGTSADLRFPKEGAAWRQRISQNRSKSFGGYRMIYPQKFKIDTRNWPCMAILKRSHLFQTNVSFPWSMLQVHTKQIDAPNPSIINISRT